MFIASEYGVGAYLPEHQVWTLGGDTLVEAGEAALADVVASPKQNGCMETHCVAGAAGLEPLHFKIGIRQDFQETKSYLRNLAVPRGF
jgi:hypothetical protein